MHKIGNLVLLNRKKNASLSNKSYADKKSRYKGAIESRQHTNYIFMNYADWNINSIEENQKRIVQVLDWYYRGNSVQTLIDIKKSVI